MFWKWFRKEESPEQIGGIIAYFNLQDWWLGEFSDRERSYIIRSYYPITQCKAHLTKGYVQSFELAPHIALTYLAGRYYGVVAHKILEKAFTYINSNSRVLDLNFMYRVAIQTYYKDRDSIEGALDQAIKYCQYQIKLAPLAKDAYLKEKPNAPLPEHVGYKQLAIIEARRGNIENALRLSREALEQGWKGDWAERVERLKTSLKQEGL